MLTKRLFYKNCKRIRFLTKYDDLYIIYIFFLIKNFVVIFLMINFNRINPFNFIEIIFILFPYKKFNYKKFIILKW